MSKVPAKLLEEGIPLLYAIQYKDPYITDPKTRKKKPRKLTVFQKICNIIVDHEMIGFVDLHDTVYLYLKREGIISHLWSEQTKNYFLYEGIPCRPELIGNSFVAIEALCRRIRSSHPAFKFFDSEAFLAERKKNRGAHE